MEVRKTGRVNNFRDFELISGYMLETIQDRATVTMERQQKITYALSNREDANDLE